MSKIELKPCPNCGRCEFWLYRSSEKMLDRSTGEWVPCFNHWIECRGCRCRTAEQEWHAPTVEQAATYWHGVGGYHWFVPVGTLRRSLLSRTAAEMRAGTLSRREVVAHYAGERNGRAV
jgi:hypothetical protein